MIDFILDVLFTPSKAWIGILFGIIVAAGVYFLFPDCEIKNTLAMGAVVVGFLVGFVLSANVDKK